MTPTRAEVEAGNSPEINRVQTAYLAWLVKELPGPQQIPPPRVIFEAGWRAAELEMATHEADGGMTADIKIATLTAALEESEAENARCLAADIDCAEAAEKEIERLTAALAASQAQLEAHRAMLRTVMWQPGPIDPYLRCALCNGIAVKCDEPNVHTDNCGLAALLGDT